MAKKSYQRKDHYYKAAQDSGYRGRAAFKLLEINKKYGILRRGMKVLDVGAWPGSWIQVASRAVGHSGLVVGIDLKEIEHAQNWENVETVAGDAGDDEVIERVQQLAQGKFDLLVSDMSPKLTGIKQVDSAASGGCFEIALYLAAKTLRPGGNFVAKTFKGSEAEASIRDMRNYFAKVNRIGLQSTRKSSNEFYIAAFGINPGKAMEQFQL